jgi:type IX secretion system PorP/SprF family membrane protein
MLKYVLSILFSLFSFIGLTQDVSFSQINNNKLYLNPAFAGSTNNPELTMSYRNQWPGLGSQFVTSFLSYEEYESNINSGFGVTLMNDRAGNGIYSLNTISTYYSNQQRITPKINVKFGLELGYKQNFIDNNKLLFEDSFNGTSFSLITNEPFMNGLKVHYFDLGSGVILFSDNWFFGFAANHINTPNQSLIFGESYLPVKYGLHGGGHISKNKYAYGSNSITYMPSFSFLKQGEFSQLTVSNNVNLGKFLFGAGFRFVEGYSYRDALIFSFGVDTGDLVFHYSYDLTTSQIGPGTGGAHEISTIIRVNNKVKNNKVSVPSCSFQ